MGAEGTTNDECGMEWSEWMKAKRWNWGVGFGKGKWEGKAEEKMENIDGNGREKCRAKGPL